MNRNGFGPENKGTLTGRGLGHCKPTPDNFKVTPVIRERPERGQGKGLGRGLGRRFRNEV